MGNNKLNDKDMRNVDTNKLKSKLTKVEPKIQSQEDLDNKIKRLQDEYDERMRVEKYNTVIASGQSQIRIKQEPNTKSLIIKTVNAGVVMPLDINSNEDTIVYGEVFKGSPLWFRVILDGRITGYVNRSCAKTYSEIELENSLK